MKFARNSVFTVASLFLLTAILAGCGDSSTQGDPTSEWEINGLLARNGETGLVSAYFTVKRNNTAYISAVVKVDTLGVRSNGDGTYQSNFEPVDLSDTSVIEVTTPLENFQFRFLVVVPDTFTFDFNQLPDNQVFASTDVVNLRWNASDFDGMTGGYFVVCKPASSTNSAIGAFELFSGTQGSISREAFRTSAGDYRSGNYNVWVCSRIAQPQDAPVLPFDIPTGVFSPNVDRVGVKGQIGAVYISPRKTIVAVAG